MRPLPQVIAWVSAALCWAPSKAAVPIEVQQRQLADGVYQFTVKSDGYVQNLNSVAVITNDDVLVFDTTTRPSTARDILARIHKLTPKPIRYVVNSHWHPDHWSGNEVFVAANPGVEIIATEQMRDFMLNFTAMWPKTLQKALSGQEQNVKDNAAKGLDPAGNSLTPDMRRQLESELDVERGLVAEQAAVKRTYPTLTYDQRMVLRHGGREFDFISVTGDAAGTTVMYLPNEHILVTGDTISAPLPYYTPPLSQHAKSIRELAALDAAIIVPGHGPAMRDKTYMMLEADLFEVVLRQTQAALRAGAITIDDVQARIDLAAIKARFAANDPESADSFDAFAKGMVRKAYIELRDSKEIPAK